MSTSISAFQLGIDLDRDSSTDQKEVSKQDWANAPAPERGPESVRAEHLSPDRLDHFIQREGRVFAGIHMIVDLWGAEHLSDLAYMKAVLIEAAECAGATVLHTSMHHFTPNGGVSGVAVLAESHISVHSWPEIGYAAFDVFMCGDARPDLAVRYVCKAFSPKSHRIQTLTRGELPR